MTTGDDTLDALMLEGPERFRLAEVVRLAYTEVDPCGLPPAEVRRLIVEVFSDVMTVEEIDRASDI